MSTQSRCQLRQAAWFVERLEHRLAFNANYFALANGPLIQNWTTISLINQTSKWNNIPGIEGFDGSTIGSIAQGTDPQTIVSPNGPSAVPFIIANELDPTGTLAGGLFEYHISDPVVAMQGNDNAPAPHLLVYLNTLNVSGAQVSFLLRDIDAQDVAAVQPFAVQYRLGTTGDFTNIPAGFTANAAGGDFQASKVTPVSFLLPGACINQPQVQLRIITSDSLGADEMIGIDNINIQSVALSTIQFSQSSSQVSEGDGTINLTITRSGNVTAASQVLISSSDLETTAGADYSGVNQMITFAANEVSKTISVAITDDVAVENAERFTLTLSAPNGATLGATTTHEVSIIDNDSPVPTGLLINELDIDPPGNVDTPFEYIEIRGSALAALNNVYLVQFEGDDNATPGGAGVADQVFDLGASTPGPNGLLLIKASTGFAPQDPGTHTFNAQALGEGTNAIENDAQTWALIYSPVPILKSHDYDTNILPGDLVLPQGAVVLDSVGWKGYDVVHQAYGTVYSDARLSVSDHALHAVTRVRNNVAVGSPSSWYYGWLSDTAGASSIQYSTENVSSNLPASASLTPGAANYTNATDPSPPAVAAAVYNFDTPATKPALFVTFTKAVENLFIVNLPSSSFLIINRATDQKIPAEDLTLSMVSPAVAKISFANPAGSPEDGDFRLIVVAANVKDLAGNAMTANANMNFSFLLADATADRMVDTNDFNVLAGHFGDGLFKFSEGDFNFDGNVGSDDFNILVAQYGKRLPAVAPSVTPTPGPFAGQRLDQDDAGDLFGL